MELPSFTEDGLEELIGLNVIGNAHLLRIVLELALVAERNDAQQHPFHERRRNAEVRACGVAALAGADEIAHVAGRPRQQRGRHAVVLHFLHRDEARRAGGGGGGGGGAFSPEEESAVAAGGVARRAFFFCAPGGGGAPPAVGGGWGYCPLRGEGAPPPAPRGLVPRLI